MYEDLLRAIQTDTDGTVLDAAITVIEEAELPEGVDPDFGVSSNEVMFSGVFGDAIRDENVYTFPSTAQSWQDMLMKTPPYILLTSQKLNTYLYWFSTRRWHCTLTSVLKIYRILMQILVV